MNNSFIKIFCWFSLSSLTLVSVPSKMYLMVPKSKVQRIYFCYITHLCAPPPRDAPRPSSWLPGAGMWMWCSGSSRRAPHCLPATPQGRTRWRSPYPRAGGTHLPMIFCHRNDCALSISLYCALSISLYCALSISLYCALSIVPLVFHCIVPLVFHCIVPLVFHCIVPLVFHCIVPLVFHCIVPLVFHCIVPLVFHYIVPLVFHCIVPLVLCPWYCALSISLYCALSISLYCQLSALYPAENLTGYIRKFKILRVGS